MPRIEIELTSARPDGTWTWRAAGAKQPKGMLDGSVLPGGAKVGDVLRADADVDIDGITVRSAHPVVQKKSEPERIEIVGSGREEPPVITNMRGGLEAGGERGRRGDRDGDRGRDRDRPGRGPGGPGRPGGPGGAGGPSRPGGPRSDQSRRPEGAGGARPGERTDRRGERPGGPGRPGGDRLGGDRLGGERPAGDRPAGDRPAGEGRPAGDRTSGDRPGRDRPSGDRPGGGRPAGDRPTTGRPGGTRPGGDRAPGDRPPRDRPAADRRERPARPPRVAEPPRPKAKRLQPGRAFRDAVLAELSPERKAVAEQILRGGIPAVRQAVEEQNAQAREVGGPEIKVDALLVVAEELLPALRAAEWRDRADAAIGIVDEISVRDLRAVVSGADTARDEEGRALAAQLRDALDRRAASERQNWVDEVSSSLDDGRIVRALRISGRPPEPGVRFPADLAKRLSDAAGEALTPDATPDRWAAVLEAVVASPARRTITPKGLPAEPGEALTKALRQAAARVPAIATLLGDPPGAPPRRPPKPTGPRTVSDPTRPPGRPTTPPPSRAVGAAGVAAPQTSGASGVDLAPPAAGGAPEPEPEPATIADAPAEATPEAEVATSTEVDETVNTELEPGPPGAELVDDETAAPPDDAAAAAPSLSDADERAEPSAAAPSAGTPTEASAERADASGPAAPGVDDMAPPLPPAPESGAEPPGAQVEVAPSRADGPVVGNGVPADELNATVAPD